MSMYRNGNDPNAQQNLFANHGTIVQARVVLIRREVME
jgi:hypothetical protein